MYAPCKSTSLVEGPARIVARDVVQTAATLNGAAIFNEAHAKPMLWLSKVLIMIYWTHRPLPTYPSLIFSFIYSYHFCKTRWLGTHQYFRSESLKGHRSTYMCLAGGYVFINTILREAGAPARTLILYSTRARHKTVFPFPVSDYTR